MAANSPYQCCTFYRFVEIAEHDLATLKLNLSKKAKDLDIRGLFILGTEGGNATICGKTEDINAYTTYLAEFTPFGSDLPLKFSPAEYKPFRSFQVKIRSEIVTLGDPKIVPKNTKHRHLKPEKWNEYLKDQNTVVIDTRNWYETDIGKFKNALDLRMNDFQEFSEKIKTADIPKDKNVLIYCTGGIRCEKAIYELEKQGYKNSYQLDGGILKYIEAHPNEEYEGECFVFDRRLAVNQKLEATNKYEFCPHCGQPAAQDIQCIRCENTAKICQNCIKEEPKIHHTCSKNCAHHTRLGSAVRTPKQSVTRQQLKKSLTAQYNCPKIEP